MRVSCIQEYVPRARIELATPSSSNSIEQLDYLTIPIKGDAGRSRRDYRWNSLASLYTFQETVVLPDLARDCSAKAKVFPNSPSFQFCITTECPKEVLL